MSRTAAAVLVCLAIVPAAAGNSVQVAAIRTFSHIGSTRILLDVSGSFEFRSERRDSDRLIFDVLNSRPWIERRRFATKKVNDALVKDIRIGEASPGVTRVVVDLAAPVSFTASQLSWPDRLAIELRVAAPATNPASPGEKVLTSAHPSSSPVSPPPANLTGTRIVIDPGHGGRDAGAIGVHGLYEKDVTLDIAQRLAQLLRSGMEANVTLTRSDDKYLTLRERTAIANDGNADVFVSIHANSSSSPAASGPETYSLNFSNARAPLKVAARENSSADNGVGQLKDLIGKISANRTVTESGALARAIENSLLSDLTKGASASRELGVRQAPFLVLVGASMPAVLTEVGFLSNAGDETGLSTPEYRQKIAGAIYSALRRYQAPRTSGPN